MRALVLAALLMWGAGASLACRPAGPLEVTTIQIGRSLNSDNTVGHAATTFAPFDTIYLSVLTADTGSGTLAVRWEYEGRVISETTREVAYRGAGATPFHLQYAGGFPEGSYAVEVLLDGVSVGRRTFTVRR